MKYALIVVATGALLASACTETKQISPDLAKMGHVVYARPAQGVPATAVFVRDIGFKDVGKTATLYIDGEIAAELETSEKAPIELTAGSHSFGVVLAPATGQPATTINEQLEAGQTYVYRLASDANGMRVERAQ